MDNVRPYEGPAGVFLREHEARELLELLSLNPRPWNADLRRRLAAFIDMLTA